MLSKPDPRVPSNWSRRFKNHQEKLKSGDVYQVAEVVRNLAARNRDASLSAAERTMYERARVNLDQRDLAGAQGVGRGGRGVPRRRPRQGRAQAGQAGGGQEDRRQVAGKRQPVAAGSATAVASVSTMRSTWSSVITNGGQNEFVSVPMARVTTPAASMPVADHHGVLVRMQRRSPHRPLAAHTGDRPVGGQRPQTVAEAPTDRLGPGEQPLGLDDVEVGERRRARRGMAGVRVAGAQQEAGSASSGSRTRRPTKTPPSGW